MRGCRTKMRDSLLDYEIVDFLITSMFVSNVRTGGPGEPAIRHGCRIRAVASVLIYDSRSN